MIGFVIYNCNSQGIFHQDKKKIKQKVEDTSKYIKTLCGRWQYLRREIALESKFTRWHHIN